MKANNRNWKRLIAVAVLGVLPFALIFNTADAAVSIGIDQCENGSPPTGICHWVTGILNNKTTYLEGMATPQRFLFGGLSGTNHTISFDMQWTKTGLHAYDWPVSWTQSVVLAQSIGHFSTTPFTTRCADLNPGDTTDCNLATITQTANVPSDPYISSQFGLPATDGSTSAKESAFSAVYGTPQVQIISDQPLTFTVRVPTHSVANNSDTGDSKVTYTLNVTGTGATKPTVILLLFAAHIAISDAPGDLAAPGTTWGQGFGAKNISGAPYHVQQPNIDGNTSSQDNQLDLSGTPLTPALVTRISNSTRLLGSPVSDTVTMTLSSSTILSGYLSFYICGPTSSATPCLPQYTTKTLVSNVAVSTTASSVTRSSANFTPVTPSSSFWCFLVQWINQDPNSQSYESFATTNECVSYSSTTAVTLSSFQAPLVTTDSVVLKWTTASEVNTAGFNVYRSESQDGPYTRINSQLLPSSADKLTGGTYRFEDTTALTGRTYYYQLEDVELDGATTRHAPVVVTVADAPAPAVNSNLIFAGSILAGFAVVGGSLFILLRKLNVL